MSNTLSAMRGVHTCQAQNKKAWNNVFMMANGNFMSLSNDKKGIKAHIDVSCNQMVRIEIEGRNKFGKPTVKRMTVTAYEGVINKTITRLLSMVANDVSK